MEVYTKLDAESSVEKGVVVYGKGNIIYVLDTFMRSGKEVLQVPMSKEEVIEIVKYGLYTRGKRGEYRIIGVELKEGEVIAREYEDNLTSAKRASLSWGTLAGFAAYMRTGSWNDTLAAGLLTAVGVAALGMELSYRSLEKKLEKANVVYEEVINLS